MITNAVYIYDKDIENWNFTSISNLEEDISGIYIIINNTLNQVYIGASTNIKKRLVGHFTTPDYRSKEMKDLIKNHETKVFIPECIKNSYFLSTSEESEYYSIFETQYNYMITNLKKLCFKENEYDKYRFNIVKDIVSISRDNLVNEFTKMSNKFCSKREKACVYNDIVILNSDEYRLTKLNDIYAESITVVLDDKNMKFLIELSDFFKVNPFDCLKSHAIGMCKFVDEFEVSFLENTKEKYYKNGISITFYLTYADFYKLNKLFELVPEFKKSYNILFNYTLEYFMNKYSYEFED